MKNLLKIILKQYAQSPGGVHGISHWARVLENGRLIVSSTDAKIEIVELFSILHDSKRVTETRDPDHGLRSAEFAVSLRGDLINLSNNDFDLLYYACSHHTNGLTDADITVQACWDSDRLDLGRANIKPVPEKLCTGIAKDSQVIESAHQKSCDGFLPSLVKEEWGIVLTSCV